jgi:hypothetical protein
MEMTIEKRLMIYIKAKLFIKREIVFQSILNTIRKCMKVSMSHTEKFPDRI